ncbi:MAG: MBL fold metallo-hydrolase, partial [Gammaproteobacteria bacterium]|nr:MBL fold metallo-hydrolase [Gammaproteobacteria bacterium]
PDNRQARELQASALEQLGYQAESGQWRNFYLTGASELRNGVITAGTTRTASPDMLNALSLDSFFDFLAVKLNGPKAAGKKLTLNFRFTDTGDEYLVTLVNGVLHRDAGAQNANADVTVTLTRAGLAAMAMLGRPVATLLDNAVIQANGDVEALEDLVSLLDNFEFWFDIVTP